jgi:hypothetical protein
MNQYRADISVVLLVAHDMLLGLIPDLRSLFRPSPRNVVAKSIHQKCLILMTAQVVVGCPIKTMDRFVQSQNDADDPGAGSVPKRLDPIAKVPF